MSNNNGINTNGDCRQEEEEVAVVFLGDVDDDNGDDNTNEAAAAADHLDDEDDDDDDDENRQQDNTTTAVRLGTTSSARFNILATMVGGGSLSLPLAFAKSGNIFMGPIMLMVMAVISEYCFTIMIDTIRVLSYPRDLSTTALHSHSKVGRDSYESLTAAAFGPQAHMAAMGLVTAMCFFAMVAYAVLLRDIVEPVTQIIYNQTKLVPGPSWRNNSLLWVVVLLVTPLCTLRTLTSLKRFGAASMYSVLILGCCVVIRSVQCNVFENDHNSSNHHWHHWTDSFRLWPERWWDLLTVFPLYISCFVCHYNIPTVHNELRRPTVERVRWWLHSTTWVATAFYMVMGIAGSAYGAKCTATGQVQGNILLDFPNDDPLLAVGRTCLAITISIAFPMLTIPARDIVLRSYYERKQEQQYATTTSQRQGQTRISPPLNDAVAEDDITEPRATTSRQLREPLLSNHTDDDDDDNNNANQNGRRRHRHEAIVAADAPWGMRLLISMALLWTATSVASIVDSIDTVWDLLGSSLSIFLSVLIPAGSYLIVTGRPRPRPRPRPLNNHDGNDNDGDENDDVETNAFLANETAPTTRTLSSSTTQVAPFNEDDDEAENGDDVYDDDDDDEEEEDALYNVSSSVQQWMSRCIARFLIVLFIPLMFLSMGNAVYHTFFQQSKQQSQ